MKITTRYDLGDTVWHLRTFSAKRAAKCSLCSGMGSVNIIVDPNRLVTCPDCRGRRYSDTEVESEEIRGSIRRLTVGQVRVEVGDDGPAKNAYMAHETGVGTGSVYREESLHPSLDAAKEAGEAAGVSVWVQPTSEHEAVSA